MSRLHYKCKDIHKQEKNNHGAQKKLKKHLNSKFSNKKII